jgi:hypothetical protein
MAHAGEYSEHLSHTAGQVESYARVPEESAYS